MFNLRTSALCLALLGMSACAGVSSNSLDNFAISLDGNTATGMADPADFSDAEIQSALMTLCQARISNYATEMTADGSKLFRASCARGFAPAAGVTTATRQPNGALLFDQF